MHDYAVTDLGDARASKIPIIGHSLWDYTASTM